MKPNYRLRSALTRNAIYLFMFIITLLVIIPIYLMLINATRSNAQINEGISFIPGNNTINNWKNLTNRGFQISQGFGNSLFLAVTSSVLTIYFSALTAYALHVYNFKGKAFIWGLILLVMMLPASLPFIGFYQFVARLKLLNSYIPLVLPAIAAPAVVFFIRQYLASVLSFELIDAARIDGAGEFYTFNMVILPVIKPALATQAIFSFIGSWNNFMTPFVLLSNPKKYTLPMLVQMLRGDIYRTEYGSIYLGITVSLVPIIIFYAFMSQYIIAGITMGSLKE
ncbi:MAG TPA: carbohydrate ABC transporter permease [Termitinemataceae bacterium]|nr:carbohydrate ABC transporter permease [Termitinemataceae bacterium]HOM23326.1 carbohydrate ABC transporter permease [Termitinemataceae bacterium]HPQ00530.1 carbohydrate ABC transporter permease [Termitinemataceae bacterium]